MDSSQTQTNEFDARILDQLACPVCFGALRLNSSGRQIACVACQRHYPLIDGIAVLIPERVVGPETGGQ
jgi:uncharacterized protein YbaR (Trm112 family)